MPLEILIMGAFFGGGLLATPFIKRKEKAAAKQQDRTERHAEDDEKLSYQRQINYLYYKYF